MNNKLQQLEDLLQVHDWYYAMSDDNYYYKLGRKQYEKIWKLMDELKETVDTLPNLKTYTINTVNNMTITIKQVGKTYSVDSEDKVTVTHNHDSIISVSGEYFQK